MITEAQSSDLPGTRHIGDIPVAHTPPGGYGKTFPQPILASCSEPLVPGAPDLRGMWQVTEVEVKGKPAPKTHPAYHHYQRIEQCGDRLIVTGGGVLHDMRCDGTIEHGVHDIAARDFKSKITVAAAYENGVHVLRPALRAPIRLIARLLGHKLIVTRRRDGADMIWQYHSFKARLQRIGGTDAPPPTHQ